MTIGIGWPLLCLGYRDGRSLGVIKTVHGLEAHDHVEAIGEYGNKKQRTQQPHPDSRREEAGTVTGIREPFAHHIEALDLKEIGCTC